VSAGGPLERLARRLLLGRLAALRHGTLTLRDGDVERRFGDATDFPVAATVTVHDPTFYGAVVYGGTVGAGESYMAGAWTTDDLTSVIRIILRNQEVLEAMDSRLTRLAAVPVQKLFHALHRNTPRGSRANIAAHYDLGNDFYRLFLDDTLTYSCGIFETPASTLREASVAKYDRLCRKLGLRPEHHVLEIGTGWGGFALHAAGTYGCRVTTTTISKEQFELASRRVAEAGLTERVQLLQTDYRELDGKFDRLVSIEMIEAVGHHYLETFFRCCADRLQPEGVMALQAITIRDQVYDRHIGEVDFIKRHVFPGSCIPSVAAMLRVIARGSDLRLFHLEDITPHYATTLRLWRERFFAARDQVLALGFDEVFIRLWDFYLSYCEAGFAERYIGDVQMILTKPLCRMAPILPPLTPDAD
jgi:cyclopropane-fatty-acyl-phospholipid synthase